MSRKVEVLNRSGTTALVHWTCLSSARLSVKCPANVDEGSRDEIGLKPSKPFTLLVLGIYKKRVEKCKYYHHYVDPSYMSVKCPAGGDELSPLETRM